MMTKQEERAALAKIEKILKAAGPDSYIGMAFAGCCELARTNIENDFGCSLQDNVDTWRRNAEKEHEMRIELQELVEELNKKIDRHIAEKDTLRDSLKEAQDSKLPNELYEELTANLQEQLDEVNARIINCVDILDELADAPYDIAVGNALKVLKAERAKKKKIAALVENLTRYKWHA